MCALVSVFLTGKYNFWFLLFTKSIYCTSFLLDSHDFTHMFMCIFHYFNYHLPDFVTAIWGSSLVSYFRVFVLISLNAITNHLQNLHSWPEIKLPTSTGPSKKQESSRKNIYFCFNDYAKAYDCVDHNKLWKILKEMGIPDHLPASWEICMQVRKQQLELDMEQTGSK